MCRTILVVIVLYTHSLSVSTAVDNSNRDLTPRKQNPVPVYDLAQKLNDGWYCTDIDILIPNV